MKITLYGMEHYLNLNNDSLFSNIILPAADFLDKNVLINTIILDCGEFETLYGDPEFMKFATTNFFSKHNRTFQKWADALAIQYNALENYNRIETENYEDDVYEEHTRTDGLKKISELDGTTVDTTNNGKTRQSSEVYKGAVKVNITKPDTTVSNNSFAGFSSTGNALTPGSSTTTKIGDSSTGNYTEEHTQSMQNTDKDTSVNTVEQETAGTVEHKMTTPHTVESGHVEGQSDIDVIKHKPRHLNVYGNIGVTTSQQMLQSELDIARFNLYHEISILYMAELTLPVYI